MLTIGRLLRENSVPLRVVERISLSQAAMNDFNQKSSASAVFENGAGAMGPLSGGSLSGTPSNSYPSGPSSGSHTSLRESVNPPLRESGEQRIVSVPLSNQILQNSTHDASRLSYVSLREAKGRSYSTDARSSADASAGGASSYISLVSRNEPSHVSSGIPASKSPPPMSRSPMPQEPTGVEWDKILQQSAVLVERMDNRRAQNSSEAYFNLDNDVSTRQQVTDGRMMRGKSPPPLPQHLRAMSGFAQSTEERTTSYMRSLRCVQRPIALSKLLVDGEGKSASYSLYSNSHPASLFAFVSGSRSHNVPPPPNIAAQAWPNSTPGHYTVHQTSSASDVARIMGWNIGVQASAAGRTYVSPGTVYGQQMSSYDVRAPAGGRSQSAAAGHMYVASSFVTRPSRMHHSGRTTSDQAGYNFAVLT